MTPVDPEFEIADREACKGFEDQFSHSCEATNCGAPSKWLVWLAHKRTGCPGELYVCDEHKRALVLSAEAAIAAKLVCPRCKALHKGPLHKIVRVVEL